MRCAGIRRRVQRLYRNHASHTMTFCMRVGGGCADARHHLLTKPHRQMQTSYTCIDTYGEDPITFFFFADPGDFSGSTEAKWVLHNMKDVEIVTLFKAHCGQAFTGLLMGERISIIMTGIGPMQGG
eukprot:gene4923-34693_t